MEFLPLFHRLQNVDVLIVGAGDIAARKAGLVVSTGAKITVIAPQISETMQNLVSANERIVIHEREFAEGDIDDKYMLVIAASNDDAVNRQVSQISQARGKLVNVVDQPELCNVILPSIIDRSPIMVAVSSGGASPTLARLLRTRLESLVPAAYGRLATLAERYRQRVKKQISSVRQRRHFWQQVLEGPISELVFSGREAEADKRLQALIDDHQTPPNQGEVYLVGAGPGDPDLLTFRALRLMQKADVVLYDRLVSPAILDMVRRDAEKVYVGKKRDFHTLRQESINQTLVDYAKRGQRVLRLKGGDPFVFGRGGEEIDTLAAENITFQVVPGVSAANGCASYAGIPLTHRDYAQSVAFVTGHLQSDEKKIDWQKYIQPQQTLVIYMGLSQIETICADLLQAGMSPQMPAALIEQGTTLNQKVVIADVAGLADKVSQHAVSAPTLIIIGDVVRLQDKLAWFKPESESQ